MPLRDQGEFDAFAHGVDAFGADADFSAEMPFELAGFCATAVTRAARSAATASASKGDDGVIALAKDATGASEFLECADGKKSFYKNFEEFDKAAELLDRNDQPVVFLAEMLLHELSSFPIHEFALGAIGTALGLGGFCGDFFEVFVRVECRFSAMRCRGVHLRTWRHILRMLARPLQNPMNDEVWLSPNGRSEMCVLIEAEGEMAERLGGVASLFEGTHPAVGDDALFPIPRYL